MAAPTRILLVSGSTRPGSTNTAVLRTAQAIAPDEVATVLYGRLPDLPAFNPDDDHEAAHEAVADLRGQIAVLGYVGAVVVEPACTHVPVTRDAVGADGLVADEHVRAAIAQVLRTLVQHVRETTEN
ncbi:MAG: NADPH-dependent FMN reductase [Pseudonocardiaceae bacterium]